MKNLITLILLFCIFPYAYCEATANSVVGSYEISIGQPGNRLNMRLDCASESSCKFVTVSHWKDEPPRMDIEELNNVRAVTELVYASNALRYAVERQNQNIEHPEFAEMMGLLRPVLASNPAIDRCWDLNMTTSTYLLACTLSGTPKGSPPLYLFATLMSNCGEAFCRYLIYPLSAVKS